MTVAGLRHRHDQAVERLGLRRSAPSGGPLDDGPDQEGPVGGVVEDVVDRRLMLVVALRADLAASVAVAPEAHGIVLASGNLALRRQRDGIG
jgi:hypothetical protein